MRSNFCMLLEELFSVKFYFALKEATIHGKGLDKQVRERRVSASEAGFPRFHSLSLVFTWLHRFSLSLPTKPGHNCSGAERASYGNLSLGV